MTELLPEIVSTIERFVPDLTPPAVPGSSPVTFDILLLSWIYAGSPPKLTLELVDMLSLRLEMIG